jgi:hypothetical protein
MAEPLDGLGGWRPCRAGVYPEIVVLLVALGCEVASDADRVGMRVDEEKSCIDSTRLKGTGKAYARFVGPDDPDSADLCTEGSEVRGEIPGGPGHFVNLGFTQPRDGLLRRDAEGVTVDVSVEEEVAED